MALTNDDFLTCFQSNVYMVAKNVLSKFQNARDIFCWEQVVCCYMYVFLNLTAGLSIMMMNETLTFQVNRLQFSIFVDL